jgi:hypothetical protein
MSEATHRFETLVRVVLEAKGGGHRSEAEALRAPDDEAENRRKGWEDILSSLDDLR